jgi:hypothetical protein
MSAFNETPLFRRLIVAVGLMLFVIYGLMFIPVAVNLPASWPGAVYAAVGLAGAICSFAFLKYRRRILLVPMVIAVLMTVIWGAAIVVFGESIDRQLQSNRPSSAIKPDRTTGD